MSLEMVQHIEKAKQTDKEYNLVITISPDILFEKMFTPLNTWADDNKMLKLLTQEVHKKPNNMTTVFVRKHVNDAGPAAISRLGVINMKK